jgi:acetyl esterase/lipase
MTNGPDALSFHRKTSSGPEVEVVSNLPYRGASGWDPALNTLDIYFNPRAPRLARRSMVVFLHGGNWRGSDKVCFPGPPERAMPAWFVERSFVFVSVNFRLLGSPQSPRTTLAEMADDVAKAIKWLTVNGRQYGGRPDGMTLVGFSSGAHLAALVAADQTLRERHRLRPGVVSSVIGLDVPFYDVPVALDEIHHEMQGAPQQSARFEAALEVFGRAQADHVRFSPAAHIGPWLQGTKFLLLSAGLQSGRHQDFSNRMSAHFAGLLRRHEIAARHFHFGQMEHADMLGSFRLLPARQVEHFLTSK